MLLQVPVRPPVAEIGEELLCPESGSIPGRSPPGDVTSSTAGLYCEDISPNVGSIPGVIVGVIPTLCEPPRGGSEAEAPEADDTAGAPSGSEAAAGAGLTDGAPRGGNALAADDEEAPETGSVAALRTCGAGVSEVLCVGAMGCSDSTAGATGVGTGPVGGMYVVFWLNNSIVLSPQNYVTILS